MKTMKKILTLVLALLMVVSLALPAMASDVGGGNSSNPTANPKITIMSSKNNAVEGSGLGHTYVAYQILSGTMKPDSTDSSKSNFVVAGWGNGVDSTALLNKLTTTNTLGDPNPMASITDANSFAEILVTLNAEQVKAVAKIINTCLVDANGIESKYMEYDETAKKHKYEIEVPVGYYLIKDAKNSLDTDANGKPQENKDYTDLILHVSNDVTVYHKGSVPTVDKYVSEFGNAEKGSIETAMSQEYYYKLVATLPSDYENYSEYMLQFVDKMDKGITFNPATGIEKVFAVRTDDGSEVTLHAKSTEHPNGYELNYDTTGADKNVMTITFGNLMHENEHKLEGGDQIIVLYKAKLNENAVIGNTGNSNDVSLKYSNDPQVISSYGTTKDDSTTVYTVGVKITKVDGSNGAALAGVKFKLYHTVGDAKDPQYAIVTNGKITGWTMNDSEATELVTDANGNFTIEGLNTKVNYYLKETDTLQGYELLKDPVHIYLTAEYEGNVIDYVGMQESINNNRFVEDINSWETNNVVHGVQFKVVNNPGAVLPETGGIGTTIFYILGGIMVLGAALLLITKKRVSV